MMFIYKLSSWVDRFDPYWYSRLMALKTSYICVVLFLANLFLHPPLAPLIMMVAGVGVVLIEMPSINELKKKDLLYLAYLILICLTIGLFASYVYLRGWFIFAAAGWCYVLYSAVKKKPELFQLVSVILMLGIMAMEGATSGNFFITLNILLFICEFAMIAFWAHKLFPNLYHLVWLSATLRALESLRMMLQTISVARSPQAFSHNLVAQNVRALLKPKSYLREALTFSNWLSYYHYYLSDLIVNSSTGSTLLAIIETDLYQLELAIRKRQPLLTRAVNLSADTSADESADVSVDANLAPHYELYTKLYLTWNKLCAHANN